MVKDTLVLNRSYIPVHLSHWHHVMKLLYKEHAHALDRDYTVYTSYDDWMVASSIMDPEIKRIHTVHYEIAVPEIVVLTKYDSLPSREVKFTRQSVFQRDRYICQYCGKKFKKEELQKEHVIPKSQGGSNEWDNIVSACEPCNSSKRDRTPKQAGMKLIKKPEPPKWYSPVTKIKHTPNLKPTWEVFLKHIGG